MAQETKNIEGTLLTGLASRVYAFLGLDDAGRLKKFFDRQVSDSEKAIKSLKLNLSIVESKHSADMDERNEVIEDAQEVVKNTLLDVDMDAISSNEKSKAYSSEYWGKFDLAQRSLDELVEDKERAIEAYKKSKENITDKIEAYQKRIDLINAEK